MDHSNFLEREPTLIELAIEKPFHCNFFDQTFNPRRCRFHKNTARTFYSISQHKNSGFFRLRLGTRIAKSIFVNGRPIGVGLGVFIRPLIEILHERRAVVLLDKIDN